LPPYPTLAGCVNIAVVSDMSQRICGSTSPMHGVDYKCLCAHIVAFNLRYEEPYFALSQHQMGAGGRGRSPGVPACRAAAGAAGAAVARVHARGLCADSGRARRAACVRVRGSGACADGIPACRGYTAGAGAPGHQWRWGCCRAPDACLGMLEHEAQVTGYRVVQEGCAML